MVDLTYTSYYSKLGEKDKEVKDILILVEMVGSVIYSSIIHGEPAEVDTTL